MLYSNRVHPYIDYILKEINFERTQFIFFIHKCAFSSEVNYENSIWGDNDFQGSRLLLRDWDLWGPLLLCMVVGTILHEGEGGPHFTQFFILFWVGSAVITLNTKLLGGSISFFQSVSPRVQYDS